MKTNIYNESKDRNATATELARAIMNNAIESNGLTIAIFNTTHMIGINDGIDRGAKGSGIGRNV
jgi:DNA replication protein DnaC